MVTDCMRGPTFHFYAADEEAQGSDLGSEDEFVLEEYEEDVLHEIGALAGFGF